MGACLPATGLTEKKPMQDKEPVFIDSNVLIYGNYGEPLKMERFDALLKDRSLPPVISTQVLKEFANVCLRKKLSGNTNELIGKLDKICAAFIVREISPVTIKSAIAVHKRYRYSFYDSLVIAAALEYNCRTLYTEDLHTGQVIGKKLRIVNPFSLK